MNDVVWTTTCPSSGRFGPVENRSNPDALNKFFAELVARGQGYLEVSRADDDPLLCLGFVDFVVVVQALKNEDQSSVLLGDGSFSVDTIDVPFMDERATFSGWAGWRLESAWLLIEAFLSGTDLDELGDWFDV